MHDIRTHLCVVRFAAQTVWFHFQSLPQQYLVPLDWRHRERDARMLLDGSAAFEWFAETK
jgi:hypothetical protein